jgi:dTDP-4-amino-4,6-dideoxygalactose transaminase
MLDLTRQHARVRAAVAARVQAVFDSQQFILGQTVEEFETAFGQKFGGGHAVGMSSGTDAQLAILMALGIGPGDAIITTPYTFFATAGCIHRVGAEPVFVDIRRDTMALDADKLHEYLTVTCRRQADGSLHTPAGHRVRAIIPVHLFGACCDMDAITAAADPFDLPVIEDAAQAIGSEYPSKSQGSQRAGAMGIASYFSFFPTKNLGAAGDAGMAVCQSEEMAVTLRQVRNHGMDRQYHHHVVGGNFRLAFQDLADRVHLPAEPWKESGLEGHHTYHQYVIRAERRDALRSHLTAAGIGHAVYYPRPLHLQECFAHLGYTEGSLPEAESAARETVALPIYPELRPEELALVAKTIQVFFK